MIYHQLDGPCKSKKKKEKKKPHFLISSTSWFSFSTALITCTWRFRFRVSKLGVCGTVNSDLTALPLHGDTAEKK